MLSQTQIEKFLNGETKVAYPTIQGPRMDVIARFVRHGSEGWWMTKFEGEAGWNKEWVNVSKAKAWLKAPDMRAVA